MDPKKAQSVQPTQPSLSPEELAAKSELNATTKPDLQATPVKPAEPKASLISGNKGLIISVAAVLIAAIIGFIALSSSNSGAQYQGMIEKVEKQTQELQNSK